MVVAYGHEQDDQVIVWLVLYLAVHLWFVVWAVRNRQPWWALGIFFFPVVGDISYLIYYLATRSESRPQRRQNATFHDGRWWWRNSDGSLFWWDDHASEWKPYEDQEDVPAVGNDHDSHTEVTQVPVGASLDDLEKLADFRDRGIISKGEFEAKKRQILGL